MSEKGHQDRRGLHLQDMARDIRETKIRGRSGTLGLAASPTRENSAPQLVTRKKMLPWKDAQETCVKGAARL